MFGGLATVGSEAGAKLYEIGIQLGLLGSVVLFLGALRLFIASRSRARTLLVAGLLLFALGQTVRTLEHLGALQLNYYPGWKEDLDETFLHLDPELEFSDDDLEVGFGTPAWWEGLVWWAQRVGRMLGLGLAGTGFFLDGRWVMQGGDKERKRPTRSQSRSR